MCEGRGEGGGVCVGRGVECVRMCVCVCVYLSMHVHVHGCVWID